MSLTIEGTEGTMPMKEEEHKALIIWWQNGWEPLKPVPRRLELKALKGWLIIDMHQKAFSTTSEASLEFCEYQNQRFQITLRIWA